MNTGKAITTTAFSSCFKRFMESVSEEDITMGALKQFRDICLNCFKVDIYVCSPGCATLRSAMFDKAADEVEEAIKSAKWPAVPSNGTRFTDGNSNFIHDVRECINRFDRMPSKVWVITNTECFVRPASLANAGYTDFNYNYGVHGYKAIIQYTDGGFETLDLQECTTQNILKAAV